MKHCSECHLKFPDSLSHCTLCGKPLPPPSQEPPPELLPDAAVEGDKTHPMLVVESDEGDIVQAASPEPLLPPPSPGGGDRGAQNGRLPFGGERLTGLQAKEVSSLSSFSEPEASHGGKGLKIAAAAAAVLLLLAGGLYVGFSLMRGSGNRAPSKDASSGLPAAQDPSADVTSTIASVPKADQFAGTWINADKLTRRITKVEIHEQGGLLKFRIWDKTFYQDADRGEVDSTLSPVDGTVHLEWALKDRKETNLIKLLRNGQLKVTSHIQRAPVKVRGKEQVQPPQDFDDYFDKQIP